MTLKLLPHAKEVVIASAELPVKLCELRECTKALSEQYGVKFDYSAFESFKDPENWWMELLTNEATKETLNALIEKHQHKENPHFHAVLECAETSSHGLVEPDKDLFDRSLVFGKILYDYLPELEGKEEKLLVIGHGRIMRAMISEGVIEGKKAGSGFANTFYIDNTQCVPIYFDGSKPTHVKQS